MRKSISFTVKSNDNMNHCQISPKVPMEVMHLVRAQNFPNELYQQYIQNGRFESDLVFIESLIAELNDLISYMKDLFYENLAKI